MARLSIYCDGGARGNPGPAAAAFVVFAGRKCLHEGGAYLERATNNVAEYTAVILALEWLHESGRSSSTAHFFLDSELLVEQLNGNYKVKSPNLKPLFARAESLIKGGRPTFEHVERSKNARADALVNKILDEQI